jgi:hypothetical protein
MMKSKTLGQSTNSFIDSHIVVVLYDDGDTAMMNQSTKMRWTYCKNYLKFFHSCKATIIIMGRGKGIGHLGKQSMIVTN